MQFKLDGETRLFPIIGDPVGQVKSPASLTRIMNERGVNGLVIPIHVAADDLDAFLHGALRAQNIDGLIATLPHKAASLAFCDQATERANFVGAANVMRRLPDGSWTGDNTDGQGYMDGIAARGFDVRGKRVLLIGAGGAGSAVAFEALLRGADHLAIHDIDAGRRDWIIARLDARFPGRVATGTSDPSGFDLVANVTPAGMGPDDPLPVQVGRLTGAEFVADAITRPEITQMLAIAMEKGCATMPGAGMFDGQSGVLVDFLLGRTA